MADPKRELTWLEKKIRDNSSGGPQGVISTYQPPEKDREPTWFESSVKRDTARTNEIFGEGMKLDPNRALRVLKVEMNTGAPPSVIDQNLEEMERRMAQPGFNARKLLTTFDPVAQYIRDKGPYYASMALEDIQKQDNFFELLDRPAELWPMTDKQLIRDAQIITDDFMAKLPVAQPARAPQFQSGLQRLAQETSPQAGQDQRRLKAVRDSKFRATLDELKAEEKAIASTEEVGAGEAISRRFRENPLFMVGFASDAVDFANSKRIFNAAEALGSGAVGRESVEAVMLKRYGRYARAMERRGINVYGLTARYIGDIPALMQQFAISSAPGAIVRTGLKKASQKTVEGMIRSAVQKVLTNRVSGLAADVTVQSVVGFSGRIGATALQRSTDKGSLVELPNGEVEYQVVPGTGEPFSVSIPNAVLAQIAETGSERLGDTLFFKALDRFMGKALVGVANKIAPGIVGKARNTALAKGVRSILKGGGIQSPIGESVEERASELGQQLLGTKPMDLSALVPEALGGSLPNKQIIAEVLSIGALQATAIPLSYIGRNTEKQQNNPLAIKAMAEQVRGFKRLKELPEVIEDMVKNSTEDTPREHIYTPLDTFNQAFGDPREAARDITGSYEAYDEALVTGSIQIPTKRWAVTIAMDQAQSNAMEAEQRFNPNEVSESEAKAAVDRAERKAQESAVEVEEDADLDAFEQELVEKLVATGERSQGQAQTEAKVTKEFIRNLARVLQKPTSELTGAPENILNISGPLAGLSQEEVVQVTDRLDAILNRVRAGEFPDLGEGRGPSLLDFVRDLGGIDPDSKGGRPADDVRAAAVEAGFLPEGASLNDLTDALDRGEDVFAAGEDVSPDALALIEEMEGIQRDLGHLGIDIQEVTNEVIKQAFLDVGQTESPNDPYVDTLFQAFAQDVKDKRPRATIQFEGLLGGPLGVMIQLLEEANLTSFQHEMSHNYLRMVMAAAQDLLARDPGTLNAEQKRFLGDVDAIKEWLGRKAPASSLAEVKKTAAAAEKAARAVEKKAGKGSGEAMEARVVADAHADALALAEDGGGADFMAEVARTLGANIEDEATRKILFTPYHELWARGFEAYLFTGKAPSLRLKQVFAKMKKWFQRTYKTLVNLDVDLGQEIRDVYDRLLASKKEIDEARLQLDRAPLLDPVKDNLTPAQAAAYQKLQEEAERVEAEPVDTAIYEPIEREKTKTVQDRREEIFNEALDAVDATPVQRALAFLQDGKQPNGSPLSDEQGEPYKLAREEIVNAFGAAFLERLPPGKKIYQAKGGVALDVAAVQFGFENGIAMIEALELVQPRVGLAKAITDGKIQDEFGDVAFDGTLPAEVDKAMHNDARGQVILKEIEILDAQIAETEQDVEERALNIAHGTLFATILPRAIDIRKRALEIINAKKARELVPDVYLRGEALAARNAREAFDEGKLEEALEHKKNELLNHELFRVAAEARKNLDQVSEFMSQFSSKAVQDKLNSVGPSYLEQINKIRRRFGWLTGNVDPKAKPPAPISEWVEAQKEIGFNPVASELALAEDERGPWQDLTVEEVFGLRETVKNMAHLADIRNTMLLDQKGGDVSEVAARVVAALEKNATGPRKPAEREPNLSINRLKSGLVGFFASGRKFASLIFKMDGQDRGGPLWEIFVRPLNKVGDIEVEQMADGYDTLKGYFQSVYTTFGERRALYKKQRIEGTDIKMSKQGQMMTALYWGHVEGRERLLNEFSQAQIESITNNLQEKDWQVIKNVWKHADTFWAETAALSKRVDGVTVKRVEAVGYQTPFGFVPGGYTTLKYNKKNKKSGPGNASTEAARNTQSGKAFRLETQHGSRQERAEHRGDPLRLDFGVLFEHVSEVIHDQTHYELMLDLGRILSNPEVSKAITEFHGPEVLDEMADLLKDVTAGETAATTHFERGINVFRTGTTVASLAWNTTVAMMQPLGITNAIARIDPKYVGRGLSRWLGDTKKMEDVTKWVIDVSRFMRNRPRNITLQMSEVLNSAVIPNLPQELNQSYFYFIQKAQFVADIVTWLGAYEKFAEEASAGMSEAEVHDRAVALADQTVEDTQGTSMTRSLSKWQRGGPIAKTFTNFYSFGSVLYNQSAEKLEATEFTVDSMGRLIVDFLLLYTIPIYLIDLIRTGMRGDDDDDQSFTEKMVREHLSYMLGTVIGFRELTSAVEGHWGYQGPAGLRFFADLNRLIQVISDNEWETKDIKALNRVTGILFHYPSIQVERTLKGMVAILEGETINPLAPLVGPPRRERKRARR